MIWERLQEFLTVAQSRPRPGLWRILHPSSYDHPSLPCNPNHTILSMHMTICTPYNSIHTMPMTIHTMHTKGRSFLRLLYHCLGCLLPWAVLRSPPYLTSITWPTICIPTKGSKMCSALGNSQQKFQCTCLSRGGQQLNSESNLSE